MNNKDFTILVDVIFSTPRKATQTMSMCLLFAMGIPFALASESVVPVGLQVENLVQPLGVDERIPRFSWRYDADGEIPPNWVQSAYRIVVASSEEILARDEGDLWDSGKVRSAETREVLFGGQPLASRTHAWWKVQVWDGEGRAMRWSEPTTFSTGLLNASDWEGKWITDKADYPLMTPVVGALSAVESHPANKKWIELDLGQSISVERIGLFPAKHFGQLFKAGSPKLFPKSFKVVAATKPDFADRKVLAQRGDVVLAQGERVEINFDPCDARYLRIEVDELGRMPLSFFQFDGKVLHGVALGEIEVWAEGKNVALGRLPKMSDTINDQSK